MIYTLSVLRIWNLQIWAFSFFKWLYMGEMSSNWRWNDFFSKKLQKPLTSVCEMHTYFIFGFKDTPLLKKLVKGLLIAEWVGLHTIEEINFCNLNFIFRFTFDSRLVFDPLKSEITIHLGVVCPSPIDCKLSAVWTTSLFNLRCWHAALCKLEI